MAQGYERRQETQSLAPPSVRPATVRGPGVGMPGGGAPQVDASIGLAIGELARHGSAGMNQLIERKRKQSYLEGQAMYAQGKTLVELEEAGGNYYTKEGWQTMDAQNAGALWAVAQEQKIEDSDYELEPEEYRKGMAKSIADLTKDKDPRSSAMVLEVANKYLPGLASKQFEKNYRWRKERTINSAVDSVAVLSAAEIDKPDWLATLSRDEGTTMGKLTDDEYSTVLVGGILKAYENNNPNAHKWAEEAGMLQGPAWTPDKLATLRQAEAQYQARKENEYNEQYILDMSVITSNIQTGKVPVSEALGQVKALNEKNGYRFDQQDAKAIAGQALNAQERVRREAEAEAKAAARQAQAESEAQQYAFAYQDHMTAMLPWQQKLANREITGAQYLQINADSVISHGLKFNQGFASQGVSAVAEANNIWMEEDAKNMAYDQANATGDYTGLSAGQTQDAIDRQRTKIFQGAQEAINEGRGDPNAIAADASAKWHNFLERTGQIDARTKGVFNTFLNGSLLDSKGEVPVNVEKAFGEFMEMYKANPQLAMRHVTGEDAKARVQMMIDHYQEPGNFGGALLSVATVEANAKTYGLDPTKMLQDPITQSRIGESVDDFLDDRTIGRWTGIVDTVFGDTTWQQYFNTNDASMQRAAEGVKDWLPTAIKNEAILRKSRNPGLDDKSAVEAAANQVARETTYIGGSFIRTKGYNVLDKMFKDGASKYSTNPAIPNDALYTYLDTYGNDIWKEELFGESLPDPEVQIVPDPTGTGLLVSVRRHRSLLDKVVGRTVEWTSYKPVPYRSMGILWESQYKTGLEMPRRLRQLSGQQMTPEQMQKNIDSSTNLIKDTLGLQ